MRLAASARRRTGTASIGNDLSRGCSLGMVGAPASVEQHATRRAGGRSTCTPANCRPVLRRRQCCSRAGGKPVFHCSVKVARSMPPAPDGPAPISALPLHFAGSACWRPGSRPPQSLRMPRTGNGRRSECSEPDGREHPQSAANNHLGAEQSTTASLQLAHDHDAPIGSVPPWNAACLGRRRCGLLVASATAWSGRASPRRPGSSASTGTSASATTRRQSSTRTPTCSRVVPPGERPIARLRTRSRLRFARAQDILILQV